MGIRDVVRIKDINPEELCLLFWQDPECTRRILAAGVSPAFLANVLEENRQEPDLVKLGDGDFREVKEQLLDVLIPIAQEAGEFECEQSGCFYVLNEAEIDAEGVPRCPECGGVLRSSACAFCGEPLRRPEAQDFKGNWLFLGQPFLGFYFCPTCWAEIQREKTYQLFAVGRLKKAVRLARAV